MSSKNVRASAPRARLWGSVLLAAGASLAIACQSQEAWTSPEADGELATGLGNPVRVRVMAANLTTGDKQSYDPGEGLRLMQGAHPDVILIQEFNYRTNSEADIRALVTESFGASFHYYREAGAQIPNGVISRWPIVDSGEWDDTVVPNRDFAWARIDVPGPKDLWAVSVHLSANTAGMRKQQADALVANIQAQIPAGDYLVFGGDLNTGSRTEASVNALSGVLVTTGPYPADQQGNTNTNSSRKEPYDWVMANQTLSARAVAVSIGNSVFPNGLVLDSRRYSPLAEVSPVQTGDSAARFMQHMGVVRDFSIPGDTRTPWLSLSAPNGGENWPAGTVQTIRWTSGEVTSVDLEYSLDNGASWRSIASGLGAASSAYSWTVPASATTAARVRIRDASSTDASVSDDSDRAFTISVVDGGQDGGTDSSVLVNEAEPNDGPTSANRPVGNGKAIVGSIGSSQDADWYRIEVGAQSDVSVSVAIDTAADLDWFLYRENNTSTVLAKGYTVANPEAASYAAAPGVYLLKVTGYRGATSGYRLTVQSAPGGVVP